MDILIKDFVKKALLEDIGRGDLFQQTSKNFPTQAKVIAKEGGIFSGERYALALLDLFHLKGEFYKHDMDAFECGETLLIINGGYLEILQIERTLLNCLQHSSGIATNTASYVKILRENNLPTLLLDTRKTRPHLRTFEKYSVRNGGASNHRLGLDDCLMLKDTHLSHIKDLKTYIKEAKSKIPFGVKIEIEISNLQSAIEAMESGCDIVMCDNMTPSEIAEIVKIRDARFCHIILEASGNISKDTIVKYAKSGVDAISCGALIHQATWLDMSLKIIADKKDSAK